MNLIQLLEATAATEFRGWKGRVYGPYQIVEKSASSEKHAAKTEQLLQAVEAAQMRVDLEQKKLDKARALWRLMRPLKVHDQKTMPNCCSLAASDFNII